MEGIDKSRRGFVQEVLNSVADLLGLPIFGSGEPLPTPTPFLLAVDLRPQITKCSVVVSPERTELASMGTDVFSVLNVDRRKVPFSEVYACFFLSLRLFVLFDFGSC
nr:hypothetical protein [Salinibacter ruber]